MAQQNLPEQVPFSAGQVGHHARPREVVAVREELVVHSRDGRHPLVEPLLQLGVCRQEVEERSTVGQLGSRSPLAQHFRQVPGGIPPLDRHHPEDGAHRSRSIIAQQARKLVGPETSGRGLLEDAVGRQVADESGHEPAVHTLSRADVCRGHRRIADVVGEPQLGHGVDGSRKDVQAGHLPKQLLW
jgi:hypothetical protein